MEKIIRKILPQVQETLQRGKSVLLLGPRQVGKTTLLEDLALDLYLSLARPALRQQYERDIDSFTQEMEALRGTMTRQPVIAVDEIQKVPELLDAVQDLIDRKIAQFVLTGSSARKLKMQHQLNWLPGRIVYFHLDPLNSQELPPSYQDLEQILAYGCLPGIVTEVAAEFRERDLASYVVVYLEEEVRQEALVRKVGDFAKFLTLAAAESGQVANFNNISQDIDVAQTTVAAYYQILVDCLVMYRIEPWLQPAATRRRLAKAAKYLFFDLGVRRLAAYEGPKANAMVMGQWFEQFIGLELLHLVHQHEQRLRLNFWRDLEGREIDWVLSCQDKIIPIEVKWTERPSLSDARHLKTFLADYQLNRGYIVCRCARMRQLDEQIIALPWQDLMKVLPA